MKRYLFCVMLFLMMAGLCACGATAEADRAPEESGVVSETAHPDPSPSAAQAAGGVDLDLTQLSSTMVYSEVYSMMFAPEEYVGKTIKINGQFSAYEDTNTGKIYPACIVADATACCAQGIEFVRDGSFHYPEDYPELGTEITVTGVFQTYEENGTTYCHLVDAVME